jgi:hypothetical protein
LVKEKQDKRIKLTEKIAKTDAEIEDILLSLFAKNSVFILALICIYVWPSKEGLVTGVRLYLLLSTMSAILLTIYQPK